LKEYPPDINLQLEDDFKNMLPQSIIIDKHGNKFVVDFAKMEEYSENKLMRNPFRTIFVLFLSTFISTPNISNALISFSLKKKI
jgi:hypothetical protein